MAKAKFPCTCCGNKASRKSTLTQKVRIVERNGLPVDEIIKAKFTIRVCTKCKTIVYFGR